MLEIEVIAAEHYDETRNRFVVTDSVRVRLEHSLVSVSKWESFYKKPFLSQKKLEGEELVYYLRCMILGEELPELLFEKLLVKHSKRIIDYINDPMTATNLPAPEKRGGSRETITSELIYYWMVSMQIPPEYEEWHLNRLVTLIRVINFKNTPKKKMTAAQRAALNRKRLAKHGTRG